MYTTVIFRKKKFLSNTESEQTVLLSDYPSYFSLHEYVMKIHLFLGLADPHVKVSGNDKERTEVHTWWGKIYHRSTASSGRHSSNVFSFHRILQNN